MKLERGFPQRFLGIVLLIVGPVLLLLAGSEFWSMVQPTNQSDVDPTTPPDRLALLLVCGIAAGSAGFILLHIGRSMRPTYPVHVAALQLILKHEQSSEKEERPAPAAKQRSFWTIKPIKHPARRKACLFGGVVLFLASVLSVPQSTEMLARAANQEDVRPAILNSAFAVTVAIITGAAISGAFLIIKGTKSFGQMAK